MCIGVSLVVVVCVVIVKTQKTVTVSDKVKNRLEQLDDFEEVRSVTSCHVIL